MDNHFYHGDCLQLLDKVPDRSVDLILADLPYGCFKSCRRDVRIPLEKLWPIYQRVIKFDGVIALTANDELMADLICIGRSAFKRAIPIIKDRPTTQFNREKRELAMHEYLLLFYTPPVTFNPQPSKFGDYHPDYLEVVVDCSSKRMKFSKPPEVFEYAIKTYSNEGDLVLDNTAGSGASLGVASKLGRKFIGMELDDTTYYLACSKLLCEGVKFSD